MRKLFPSPVVSATLVGTVVVCMLCLQAIEARRSCGRIIGITIDQDTVGGITVLRVIPGRPAEAAGIRPGDAILAIDGQPTTEVRLYDLRAARFEPRQPVTYSVRRGQERLDLVVRPGVPFPLKDFSINVAMVLAYLGLALLSLFQRPEDLRARLLFLFSSAVAFEFSLPSVTVGNPAMELLALTGFYFITAAQIGLLLHLASVIPVAQSWLERRPWVVPVFYFVGFALGGVTLFAYLAEQLGRTWFPWTSVQAERTLFDLGLPLWALGVLVLLANHALRFAEPKGRMQAALVLAGVVPWVGFVCLSTAQDLLGTARPTWFSALEPAALFVLPVAVFFAIFRYQLFDMELVVRRSLVYTALSTTLLVAFYASLGAAGAMFSSLFEEDSSVWVVAAATLILGLLFAPLRRGVEELTYRRFFPERLALRQRLTELAARLPAQGKLPLMGRELVTVLCEIFSVRWATILIADPKSEVLVTLASTQGPEGQSLEYSALLSPSDPGLKLLTRSGRPFSAQQLGMRSAPLAHRLSQLKAALVIPLISEQRLIGLLILGPKANDEEYYAEERDLLNLFAHHVATVFEYARLFESATRDRLTGLLRREAILEKLDRELQRAVRHRRPFAIAMADLDHFKRVNDRFGHLVGDNVLSWVARLLAGGLRGTDFVGRYGGEEFLLVLPETELQGAFTVADKVRRLVAQDAFRTDSGEAVRLTISIGLAALDPTSQDEPTASHLIDAADRSLYQAKAEGRNRVLSPASARG